MDSKTTQIILDNILLYGPKVLLALVILIAGLWFINNLSKVMSRGMDRTGLDKDLQPFLISLSNVLLKVMLLLIVANIMGIQTTSFVAVIASAAFAVGLALQGSLSNFASGVMILIFKPYKVGDSVELQGQSGHISEIQIFNTLLVTDQNKTIIIPNAAAISGIITNLSTRHNIRVDLRFPISYEYGFDKVQSLIQVAVQQVEGVKTEMPVSVALDIFQPGGYQAVVQFYVLAGEEPPVIHRVNQQIKITLEQNNIQLGYPKWKK